VYLASGTPWFGADDLHHKYATWSLAAGLDMFTLARRMGTSVAMIDRTYGHLMAGADAYERELLDAFDAGPTRLERSEGPRTDRAQAR
jgi:integrase